MLHHVGERKIEQVGAPGFEQLDAGIEHEKREIGAVHVGGLASDERLDILYAVLRESGLAGAFRGEADPLQAAAQHLAQLVLGGNRRDARPGIGKRSQDRARGDQRGVGDHHLLAGRPVEIIVAGDSVHFRRSTGDDRHVVRVGEGRHRGIGDGIEALRDDPRDVGEQVRFQAMRNVARIAAVEADHDGRNGRPAVAAAVDPDLCVGPHRHASHSFVPGDGVTIGA